MAALWSSDHRPKAHFLPYFQEYTLAHCVILTCNDAMPHTVMLQYTEVGHIDLVTHFGNPMMQCQYSWLLAITSTSWGNPLSYPVS